MGGVLGLVAHLTVVVLFAAAFPAHIHAEDDLLLAVSVLAPTAMEADAWATALLVLGSEKGMQLAEKENLAALFVERGPTGIQVLTTPNFPR